MKEKRIKSVIPIYAAAAAWLIYSISLPLYRLLDILLLLGSVIAIYALFSKLFPGKVVQFQPKEEKEPVDPELDAVLKEGRMAIQEMGRLYASIPQPDVKAKIIEIMNISEKIIKNAQDDRNDLPKVQKFLSFYLPTTIKLLNAYDRMYAQGISGENISGTMTRIEDMLGTIVEAYKKQLDALFAGEALDIETDIMVMDGMMRREGLKDGDFKTQAQ